MGEAIEASPSITPSTTTQNTVDEAKLTEEQILGLIWASISQSASLQVYIYPLQYNIQTESIPFLTEDKGW